ncbi:MAG: T9SS type B sorting domain-containing protein [Bacteroidota bacterium]
MYKKLIALTFLLACTVFFPVAQTIDVYSISQQRQPTGDVGYTLDGSRMINHTRAKLTNLNNFGPTGTYRKTIIITDAFSSSGSLTQVTSLDTGSIFFFGSFNELSNSYQRITLAEVDSLYAWSLRGGKLIITSGQELSGFYRSRQLNGKWGYNLVEQSPTTLIPTLDSRSTDLFSGPFGSVNQAQQGGSLQSVFNLIPPDAVVLATNILGIPSLVLDCKTLDLLVSDVDVYTDLGGLTFGTGLVNDQDRFLANTFAFMDRLQPPPKLDSTAGLLTLNATYNGYTWFQDASQVSSDSEFMPTETGTYYAEVITNGGCRLLSDSIRIVVPEEPEPPLPPIELEMPNVFTPNNDGVNDRMIPVQFSGVIEESYQIYDRWGKLVHEGRDLEQGWNGNFRSRPCPEGVYYWTLLYTDRNGVQVRDQGNVTLMR